jgi:hypothetical protein
MFDDKVETRNIGKSHSVLDIKSTENLVPVTHTYNPSYLVG